MTEPMPSHGAPQDGSPQLGLRQGVPQPGLHDGPPRSTTFLWVAAVVCALLLLVGGAVTAAALGEGDAAQSVTAASLTTAAYPPGGGIDRQSYTFWTDAAAGAARLDASSGRQVYYARGADGRWSAVGRAAARGHWLVAPLAAGQAPSLLNARGLVAYFARLRSSARDTACADLHHRLACAFSVENLTWPFVYQGATTVWLDGVTGLPLQFRNLVAGKNRPLTIITTVESIRETSTTALPPAFFTPPNRRGALWDRVVRRVSVWLRHKFGP